MKAAHVLALAGLVTLPPTEALSAKHRRAPKNRVRNTKAQAKRRQQKASRRRNR